MHCLTAGSTMDVTLSQWTENVPTDILVNAFTDESLGLLLIQVQYMLQHLNCVVCSVHVHHFVLESTS